MRSARQLDLSPNPHLKPSVWDRIPKQPENNDDSKAAADGRENEASLPGERIRTPRRGFPKR